MLLTQEQWSPEQIANRLAIEKGNKVVSYNTIYRTLKKGYMEPKGKKKNRYSRYSMLKHLRRKGWRGKGHKSRKFPNFMGLSRKVCKFIYESWDLNVTHRVV